MEVLDFTAGRQVRRKEIIQSLHINRTHPKISDFSQEEQTQGYKHYQELMKDVVFQEFLCSRHSQQISCVFASSTYGEVACFVADLEDLMAREGIEVVNLHAFAPEDDGDYCFLLRSLVFDCVNALTDFYNTYNTQIGKAKKYPERFLGKNLKSLRNIFLELYSEILAYGWDVTIFIFIHGLDRYHDKRDLEFITEILSQMRGVNRMMSLKGRVKILYIT